jgi:hypothetical protein
MREKSIGDAVASEIGARLGKSKSNRLSFSLISVYRPEIQRFRSPENR